MHNSSHLILLLNNFTAVKTNEQLARDLGTVYEHIPPAPDHQPVLTGEA